MTRMLQINTDSESVKIRQISVIRVLLNYTIHISRKGAKIFNRRGRKELRRERRKINH